MLLFLDLTESEHQFALRADGRVYSSKFVQQDRLEVSGVLRQKKRVFVSFDFDNDKALKDFLIGQAKLPDSPFEICDWSMKEAAPQANWAKEAEKRIARCGLVIVMVGRKTHKASGVLKEVKIARRLKKPICQMIGHPTGDYTAVPEAGRLYRWSWENLKKLCGG